MKREKKAKPVKRAKHLSAIVLIAMMLSAMFFIIPKGVNAEEINYFRTIGPSASNSTYEYFYGHAHGTIEDITEIETDIDSEYYQIYWYLAGASERYTTNDFTHNDTWIQHEDPNYYCVGYMPLEGATIEEVKVFVRFYQNQPAMKMGYSINNGSTWEYSDTISERSYGWVGFAWDVTNDLTWTPEILNSTDLSAALYTYPTQDVAYYLDYLGWYITWSGPFEAGEPDEEGEDPDEFEPYDVDGFISIDNIPGMLGLIGFIGMIAVPGLGVWLHKNGHDFAAVTVAKMIAVLALFVTFFMMGLEG